MPPDYLARALDVLAERAQRSRYDEARRQRYESGMLRNYAACFETPAGRAVLADLVQRYLMRQPETLELAHWHEGQRSVVLALLEAMEAGRKIPGQ